MKTLLLILALLLAIPFQAAEMRKLSKPSAIIEDKELGKVLKVKVRFKDMKADDPDKDAILWLSGTPASGLKVEKDLGWFRVRSLEDGREDGENILISLPEDVLTRTIDNVIKRGKDKRLKSFTQTSQYHVREKIWDFHLNKDNLEDKKVEWKILRSGTVVIIAFDDLPDFKELWLKALAKRDNKGS